MASRPHSLENIVHTSDSNVSGRLRDNGGDRTGFFNHLAEMFYRPVVREIKGDKKVEDSIVEKYRSASSADSLTGSDLVKDLMNYDTSFSKKTSKKVIKRLANDPSVSIDGMAGIATTRFKDLAKQYCRDSVQNITAPAADAKLSKKIKYNWNKFTHSYTGRKIAEFGNSWGRTAMYAGMITTAAATGGVAGIAGLAKPLATMIGMSYLPKLTRDAGLGKGHGLISGGYLGYRAVTSGIRLASGDVSALFSLGAIGLGGAGLHQGLKLNKIYRNGGTEEELENTKLNASMFGGLTSLAYLAPTVIGTVNAVDNFIDRHGQSISDYVSSLDDKAYAALKSGATAVSGAVVGAVGTAADALDNAYHSTIHAIDSAADHAVDTFDSVSDTIGSGYHSVVGALDSASDSVSDFISSSYHSAVSHGHAFLDKIGGLFHRYDHVSGMDESRINQLFSVDDLAKLGANVDAGEVTDGTQYHAGDINSIISNPVPNTAINTVDADVDVNKFGPYVDKGFVVGVKDLSTGSTTFEQVTSDAYFQMDEPGRFDATLYEVHRDPSSGNISATILDKLDGQYLPKIVDGHTVEAENWNLWRHPENIDKPFEYENDNGQFFKTELGLHGKQVDADTVRLWSEADTKAFLGKHQDVVFKMAYDVDNDGDYEILRSTNGVFDFKDGFKADHMKWIGVARGTGNEEQFVASSYNLDGMGKPVLVQEPVTPTTGGSDPNLGLKLPDYKPPHFDRQPIVINYGPRVSTHGVPTECHDCPSIYEQTATAFPGHSGFDDSYDSNSMTGDDRGQYRFENAAVNGKNFVDDLFGNGSDRVVCYNGHKVEIDGGRSLRENVGDILSFGGSLVGVSDNPYAGAGGKGLVGDTFDMVNGVRYLAADVAGDLSNTVIDGVGGVVHKTLGWIPIVGDVTDFAFDAAKTVSNTVTGTVGRDLDRFVMGIVEGSGYHGVAMSAAEKAHMNPVYSPDLAAKAPVADYCTKGLIPNTVALVDGPLIVKGIANAFGSGGSSPVNGGVITGGDDIGCGGITGGDHIYCP